MEGSQPPGRGHTRLSSVDERRRVARPRATTKGPLDDPLAGDAFSLSSTPTESATPSSSQLPSNITSPRSPSSAIEQQIPDKDLSFLLESTIYHSIPSQNIPGPFLSSPHAGSLTSPLPTLLANGHYRLAALACARALTSTVAPNDVITILSLFQTRLVCLSLLNLHDLAAQESKALGDMSSSFYRNPVTDAHIVPWPLRVLCVRLAALGYGEWRKGIMGYYDLGRDAREEIARAATPVQKQLWQSRLRDLGIRVANVLVEMGDLEGAAEHLSTLGLSTGKSGADDIETARVRTMEVLVWLRIGDVHAARRCMASITSSEDTSSGPNVLLALLKMAEQDYSAALEQFQSLPKTSDPMITQNLALCLIYSGHIGEAREYLEALIDKGHSFHALTFNLCTVYELCSERARDKKLALISRIAGKAPNGDFRPGGWEMAAAEFKL